ncbi:unnamed protein product [Penicillium salamii]|uniref:Homeobox domain-containing protein n=1 Tax=Penicillium salamii TaxID=1612424 RepID=A0A9W4N165_9EURO|nr:unnamed protein product [Penicillium salamii]CAG8086192.1 unnamed protein product [Penicillium salamii]CAG8103047.1 unnamed protein product [Penicillium salamii]CAG8103330.1 unnamed protein product [Penicillium salamii]CAG8119504.1 unnamed protein product [Penicillium salamii]
MVAISELLKSCLAQFVSLVDSGELKGNEVPLHKWTDELGRLRVWAANIGGHKTSQSSLDYRLRDASHIKSQIVRLLEQVQELLTDLKDVIEESDTEAEDNEFENLADSEDENLTEIQEIHQGLVDTINQLYQMSIIIRKPAQHDQLVGTKKLDSEPFQFWAKQHTCNKYPDADALAIDRISAAMARQRAILKYRERHHAKLSQGIVPENDGKSTVLSETVATEFVKEIPGQSSDMVSEAGASETSYGGTLLEGTGADAPKIPPIPKNGMDQTPFECPFCFYIITVRDKRAWARHIFRDLMPYVCIFPGCSTPNKLYGGRRQWYHHIHQTHAPTSGTDDTFDCSICKESSLPAVTFQRHVGQHLEELALFLLPRTYEDEDEKVADKNISNVSLDNLSMEMDIGNSDDRIHRYSIVEEDDPSREPQYKNKHYTSSVGASLSDEEPARDLDSNEAHASSPPHSDGDDFEPDRSYATLNIYESGQGYNRGYSICEPERAHTSPQSDMHESQLPPIEPEHEKSTLEQEDKPVYEVPSVEEVLTRQSLRDAKAADEQWRAEHIDVRQDMDLNMLRHEHEQLQRQLEKVRQSAELASMDRHADPVDSQLEAKMWREREDYYEDVIAERQRELQDFEKKQRSEEFERKAAANMRVKEIARSQDEKSVRERNARETEEEEEREKLIQEIRDEDSKKAKAAEEQRSKEFAMKAAAAEQWRLEQERIKQREAAATAAKLKGHHDHLRSIGWSDEEIADILNGKKEKEEKEKTWKSKMPETQVGHREEEMREKTIQEIENEGIHADKTEEKGKESKPGIMSDPIDPETKRQRGNLPTYVTDVLRAWFYEHLDHPYPSEEEKQMFMRQTGLSISQISNWFINARRRQLPALRNQMRSGPDDESHQSSNSDMDADLSQGQERLEQGEADMTAAKTKESQDEQRNLLWYCCSCNFGPYSLSLHQTCINCRNPRCSRCSLDVIGEAPQASANISRRRPYREYRYQHHNQEGEWEGEGEEEEKTVTWIKTHRKHLLPETLVAYHLPWEWDQDDTDYILIKTWISEDFQEELFAHTRRIREGKLDDQLSDRTPEIKAGDYSVHFIGQRGSDRSV